MTSRSAKAICARDLRSAIFVRDMPNE